MNQFKNGKIYLRRGFHYLVKDQEQFDDSGRYILSIISVCSGCGRYYEFDCLESMFKKPQRKRCDRCKRPGKVATPWPGAKKYLELLRT